MAGESPLPSLGAAVSSGIVQEDLLAELTGCR